MKSSLANDTAKSAKTLAQQIAKQAAQEPIEILKEVKEQTLGQESSSEPVNQAGRHEETQKQVEEQREINDKLKSGRRMEALNRELADIQKQDLFKALQARIAQGEEIPLEDYPELSIEQKQVLNAQMQAVRMSRRQDVQTSRQLIEPATRKGRQLFNFGKKTQVQREQTHVEKPVPPSG